MMGGEDLDDRLALARRLARQAGDSTKSLFRSSQLHVEFKADRSPVTAADRAAEAMVRAGIADRFPSDGILGEEYGEQVGASPYRWVLDPIDGTHSFVCGVPLYGTMVGVEYQGRSVLGVLYFPVLNEMIYAASGRGCYWMDSEGEVRAARVASQSRLCDCTLVVTDPLAFAKRGCEAEFARLSRTVRLCRTWGDCYGYYLVATGRADIMIDPILSIWDAAAILPILAEAGGWYCDWRGAARADTGDGIGCNGLLMPQVLEILRHAATGAAGATVDSTPSPP